MVSLCRLCQSTNGEVARTWRISLLAVLLWCLNSTGEVQLCLPAVATHNIFQLSLDLEDWTVWLTVKIWYMLFTCKLEWANLQYIKRYLDHPGLTALGVCMKVLFQSATLLSVFSARQFRFFKTLILWTRKSWEVCYRLLNWESLNWKRKTLLITVHSIVAVVPCKFCKERASRFHHECWTSHHRSFW